MQQHQERIFFVFIEVWRQRDHVMNPLPGFAREPEMSQRLPVDLSHLVRIKVCERYLRFRFQVKPENFRRVHCAFPVGNDQRSSCPRRNFQSGINPARHIHR